MNANGLYWSYYHKTFTSLCCGVRFFWDEELKSLSNSSYHLPHVLRRSTKRYDKEYWLVLKLIMYFYTCVLCSSIIFFYTVASFLIHQFLYPHSISHLFFSFLFCSRVLNTLVLNTWSNRVRPIVVSCFALPDHFLTLIPALKQYGDRDFIQILKEALLT